MDRIYAPWRAVYLKGDREEGCLFCRIVAENDDEKNWILHRSAHCYVVINAYPYSNGHLMVVCNGHAGDLNSLAAEERNDLMAVVARVEKALMDHYKPGGLNIGVNVGQSAGAGILGHLHVHLVPRWHGDTNFMTAIGETRVISEDLLDTYRNLKAYFD